MIIGIRMLSKHQSKINWRNSGSSLRKPKSVTHISNRATRPGIIIYKANMSHHCLFVIIFVSIKFINIKMPTRCAKAYARCKLPADQYGRANRS